MGFPTATAMTPMTFNNWNPSSTQGADYRGDITRLSVFGSAFMVSIAALACISRMLRPSGNLHGMVAVSWLSGGAALGYAIDLLKPSYASDWLTGWGWCAVLVVAAILAVSGVRRGNSISKVYGVLVITLVLSLLLFPKSA